MTKNSLGFSLLLSSFTAAAALFVSLVSSPAAVAAPADPCGGIEFTSVGECHFEFEGGCKANCQPLRFVASCDGQCNLSVNASCTADCSGSCQAECTAMGSIDCKGRCEADCNARIAADCNGDQECISYCQADCRQNCEFDCDAAANADCNGQCNACCQGSCDVDANFDCTAQCQVDLKGGCDVACDAPDGALFCDGQFINVKDLPACLQYLASNFNVKVEAKAEASGSVELSGCAMNPAAAGAGTAGLFAASLGMLLARRRRQNKA